MTGGANPLTSHASRTQRLTPAAPATRASAPAAPTLPAGCVRPLVEALERMGVDVDALLFDVGLARDQLVDPDARVDCAACGQLLAAATRRSTTGSLGLRMAAATPVGAYPLVDYLVLSSATLGAGLTRLARYFRLIGAPTALAIEEDAAAFRVVLRPGDAFNNEYGVALPILHLKRETQGRARIESVSFSHRPQDPAEFEAAFGCPVHVGAAWTGFVLSRGTWELPMRRHDPVLLGVLERHAEDVMSRLPADDNVLGQLRRALTTEIADGRAEIGAVARRLATTPRTLQRRLAEEGTTFQEQVDQVRREAAERHLGESVLSIAEISFVLGYSEPAAFHRAFRRWHRTTPQAYRLASRA